MKRTRSILAAVAGIALATVVLPAGPAGADAGAGWHIDPVTAAPGASIQATEMTDFPDFVCASTEPTEAMPGPFAAEWRLVDATNASFAETPIESPRGPVVGVSETGLPVIASGSVPATDGAVTVNVTIPADAVPGAKYVMTGECVDGNGNAVMSYFYSTLFVVAGDVETTTTTTAATTPPATPPPPATVAPATPATPKTGNANYTG